mgnify:CR=1 FL=1
MDLVSPTGTLKLSEKAPQKAVELSSAPIMLAELFTAETADSDTVTFIFAVTPSSAVMVTVWEPTFAGTTEKLSFELVNHS